LDDKDVAALLQRKDPQSHGSVDRYLADLQVNGGNSGGPVYKVDAAAVIGVCVATQTASVMFGNQPGGPAVADGRPLVYSAGLTIVVPAKYVVAFLNQNGLAWDPTTVQ